MTAATQASGLRPAPPPQGMRVPTRHRPAGAPAPAPNAYRASLRAALLHACRPWALDAWTVAALAALGQGQRCREGARVFVAGETPASSLWLLVSGRVSLGQLDGHARWRQSRELHAGDWIDAGSAWTGASPAETALALEPCLVHEFPMAALLPLCAEHADLTRALLACVATRGREAVLERQALMTQDIMGRLATWLLQHATPQADGRASLQLRQQKKDLASELGVTPETLSRSLRQLQQQGLLEMQGYRLRLPDLAALGALAHPGAGLPAN